VRVVHNGARKADHPHQLIMLRLSAAVSPRAA